MRKINFVRARQTVKTSAMSRPRLITLLLALVTLVVYLPVVQCDFINFDDPVYVTDNRHVQDGQFRIHFECAFPADGHDRNSRHGRLLSPRPPPPDGPKASHEPQSLRQAHKVGHLVVVPS